MVSSDDMLIQRGRPWFSIGMLIGVAVLAASGAGVFFTVRSGQEDITKRLATNELAVIKAAETLAGMATDMRAMRYDVNTALGDRWTGTDTRFWGLEMDRFWSDFARLNPTVVLPPSWPAPKRVSTNEVDGGR